MTFGGSTFDEAQDGERLRSQLARVRSLMLGGGWWTLAALCDATGGSEAGISARIRDLRKPRFGAYVVERRRVLDGHGLWEYRLDPRPEQLSLKGIR